MLADKIRLSAREILEKDFKTSLKGYNPDEVDKFLDIVIKDYETFYQEIEMLQQENLRLKKKTDEPQNNTQIQKNPSNSTNYDILKRISNLEKHVFGSKLYE
ncbi:cell division regulator GpsB [Bacillus solimangrovi]|uniref:Cell cycle protein GpsB n=1 Tax=Bacillus solimangrovi TaxID=1305675 RepID=A0A1E5LFX6_9BACI|nr:cell division regulator GpsB [Bacillus solimangrovi]OEH92985.1 cell division protein DivIVA [Bacillus solimangrovi]